MREDFEKLPSIKWAISSLVFDDYLNEYKIKEGRSIPEYTLGFINGAWWAHRKGWGDA